MKRTHRVAAVVGAASALVLFGPSALAAPPERGVDENSWTDYEQCGDYTIRIDGAETVRFMLRQRPNGDLFWSGHVDAHETYTNEQTGRSWTTTNVYHEHDTRVLERDGDVITLLVTTSFRFTVYDEQGARDSVNQGLNQFTLVIDTKGTADPEDDDVVFGDLLKSVGSFRTGDLCGDAERFTTG